MQNENQTQDRLQAGEIIMSPEFLRGKVVETKDETIIRINWSERDEEDITRVLTSFKVISVKPRRAASGGDLVMARRMISPTEEGDEIIEFVCGGTSRRAISLSDIGGLVEEAE